jgi:hypothetical protein
MNDEAKMNRKVVKIEILYLGNKGYGPSGLFTREQWRDKCIKKFQEGPISFARNQKNGGVGLDYYEKIKANFDFEITFDDNTQEKVAVAASRTSYDFIGENFKEIIDFEGINFDSPALFYFARFYCPTVWNKANFRRGGSFRQTTFDKAAIFRSLDFETDIDFSGATFHELINFSGTAFDSEVNFIGATFCHSANFNDATFSDRTFFSNTTFKALSKFQNTLFKGESTFDQATFIASADFSDACFENSASFDHAQFDRDIKFSRAKFSGTNSFRNVQFHDVANFETTLFRDVGHFENAVFTRAIPSFRGCKIEETRLEFSGEHSFTRNSSDLEEIKNISFLKRLSDEHGQTDQSLDFNALELRAKQRSKWTPSSFKLVIRLYDLLSDFGRSYTKPLKAYLVLAAITFVGALGFATYGIEAKDCTGTQWNILSDLERTDAPCKTPKIQADNNEPRDEKIYLSGYRAAAEYTLYRAAGVLDFSDNGKATDAVARRLFRQSFEPTFVRAWGAFKAIVSTALLFLTALGLRNKFRIK